MGNKHQLKVLPISSFDNLCYGMVPQGIKYAQAVFLHSMELAKKFIENGAVITKQPQINVIAIPRGGVPTAEAFVEAFNACIEQKAATLIHSHIKTTPASLYEPENFKDKTEVIIADGVIGTGNTVCDHIAQVPSDWQGPVTVFANAASEMGMNKIAKFVEEEAGRDVTSVIGHVFPENECQWVQLGEKKVYFVGYNEENNVDYQLPDFGDHITPTA